MKKITYLGFYDVVKTKITRNVVLAATNKMTYICNALNDAGYKVDIVSASDSINFDKGEKNNITENIALKTFTSKKFNCKVLRVLERWLFKTKIFFYLLKNIKKNEKLIVYHSLGYIGLVFLLKKIKKFKLILEVEEIYGDVIGSKKTVDKELKFFKKADAYIFPTKLLDEKINTNKKPFSLIHGTYQVEEQRGEKFGDGRVHVVYAGTFDPRKGGAIAAVATGMFLSEKYHLHILGFGSNEDKQNLLKTIEDVSNSTKCKITYDGLKSGEEYNRFIQSCDIGVSTQNPNAAFNDTSFPSKILSYMANGLRVVSIKIPVIEGSAIDRYMYYYESQTSEEIAKAIMNVDLNDNYDSREVIKKLDKEFIKDIGEILENL